MIKRVAVIAVITLFFLLITSAKAATLTGNVALTVNNANGTNINYKLYNVSSTSGTITLFDGRIATLDNNGGGVWKREDVFPLTIATAEDAQYCIKIDGDYINITNSTGALKASLYDPLFWDYVNQNGSDIRVTNQDGQIYFWIENFNATTQQATIWVNLTAGSTELNLIYGNSYALTSVYNNRTKTFEFFDDFSGTSLDTSKWDTYISSGGSISVSDGSLVLTRSYTGTVAGGNAITWVTVNSTKKFSNNIIIYTKIKFTTMCNILTDVQSNTNGFYLFRLDARSTYYDLIGYYPVGATSTTVLVTGQQSTANTWYYVKIVVDNSNLYFYKNNQLYLHTSDTSLSNGFIGITTDGTDGTVYCDWIFVANTSDPATFGTPYSVNITTINATASINSVNYVAPALNITVPSQTFTLPALTNGNWFNFSAQSGQFSANITFTFTSVFTQTQTTNFTELIVSTDVYVPANCTSNTLTVEFNTSDVPSGVVIYNYNLSVLVNGTQVNFTKTATENLGVWYITVTLNNLKQGWHSVKVLFVYQPAYLNITVYDANNVTLLDKTLNVTVYDSNFNVLTSATVNKTANISVVFAGKVFVRVSNGIGIARQLETTITPGNTTYMTFYFPTQNVVLATIQLVDYTNSFSNATVIIKRYITRNNIEVIDMQKVSANLQTSHYLIANVPYEVYITNGVDTRDLGYISVAYSQTIQLVIGNILNVQAFPYVGVAFNISTSNNTISITYKTIKGTTSAVSVEITNSTGYEVYNTTLTTPEGKITYLITNPNETYYVSFHAENSFEPVSYKTIISVSGVQFEPVLPVVSGGAALAISAQSLPVWARLMFFGGLGIFVALLFRRQNVAIGLTMSFAVLALFTLMGILPVHTNTLWVLAILVVVAWFVWWRER